MTAMMATLGGFPIGVIPRALLASPLVMKLVKAEQVAYNANTIDLENINT